ncbi:MAG: tetratricopeptide repeat protein [Myxococcales bacterium]|nr:tetratricopeptide repeat protein [Myxococcales bacterium]
MSARAHFESIACREDSDIDLAEAALWIAAEEYPELDVDAYLARFDEMAQSARPKLEAASSENERAKVLLSSLLEDEGFVGNTDRYEDPRNSYLNEVLDRKVGIPITLWLVVMEVARRAGFDVSGISFPGHFLGRLEGAGSGVVFDAFYGVLLTLEDCESRLKAMAGESVELSPAIHLRKATRREILVRILTNLKHIGIRNRDFDRVLGCSDRILLLTPDAPLELRDRGVAYEQLECFSAAIIDFQRYLELAPDGEAAGAISRRVESLHGRVKHMN